MPEASADKFACEVKAHDFSGTLGSLFKLSAGSAGDILLWIGLPLLVLSGIAIGATEAVSHVFADSNDSEAWFMIAFFGGYMLLMMAVYAIPVFLVEYLSQRYLGNRDKNLMSRSFKQVFKRLLPILGTGFLAYPAIGFASLLLYVPGIILMLGWAVTPQALLVEGLGPLKALKRSWHLTRDNRLSIFGLFAVCYGISYAASLVLIIPLYIVMMAVVIASAGSLENNPYAMFRAMYIMLPLAAGASLISNTLYMSLTTVIYYNLRIKKEGFIPDSLKWQFERPVPGAEL